MCNLEIRFALFGLDYQPVLQTACHQKLQLIKNEEEEEDSKFFVINVQHDFYLGWNKGHRLKEQPFRADYLPPRAEKAASGRKCLLLRISSRNHSGGKSSLRQAEHIDYRSS